MKKFFASITIMLTVALLGQGFTVNNTNGNLIDACGNNFIMKGMNVPLAWYVNDVNGSIGALKTNTKSNCLRIVVQKNTSDDAWQTCVRNCINNKIIPMVELHDVTGSTDANALKQMGEYWASKASFLNSTNSNGVNIQKHILINLANEWGTWQTATDGSNGNTAWRDAVIAAIKPIRDAGIKTTIVVDAVGYGQDVKSASNIQKYGKAIQNADAGYLSGTANILFSIHMYCQWATGGDSQLSILSTIKNAGLPVIVGEFGYQHDNGNGGVCDIPEQSILNTCQSTGIGWLAWSQKGNGSPVQYLDLCNDWACNQLSAAWGATIVNGTNGTKTAVECSVFSNQSCSTTCTTPSPAVVDKIQYCQGAVANQLTATGTALKWYTTSSGGTGTSVSPTPSTTIVGSNVYYVTQTLNNCESPRVSITVTINSKPSVSISGPLTSNKFVAPADILISANASGGTISKMEFYNGTQKVGEDSSSPYSFTLNGMAAGSYTLGVIATNSDLCASTMSQVTVLVDLPTAINEVEFKNDILIYPNPFVENTKIIAEGEFDYKIYTISGSLLEKGQAKNDIVIGSTLGIGIYLLELKQNEKVINYKIVKK